MKRKFCQWLVDFLCGEDLLWLQDSEQSSYEDLEEMIQDSIDGLGRDGLGMVDITITRAFNLKDKTYRVEIINDDGDWTATEI